MATLEHRPVDHLTAPFSGHNATEFDRIAPAIDYLLRHWRQQPGLDRLAAHIGISPAHFQRLFRRWAGISPKRFLQALSLDHAKILLRNSASVLETAYEVGLSGPGRLHDLFVSYEAMSPGTYKSGGAGLALRYGFHDSPFGVCLVVANERGLCGLGFIQSGHLGAGAQARADGLENMAGNWPAASYQEDPDFTCEYISQVFGPYIGQRNDRPLKLLLIGSDLQIKVWDALLRVPVGALISYGDIARAIDKPKAARAVGRAVGQNPVSVVVPCHRVLQKSGMLGGYRWGVMRKGALIGWELANPLMTAGSHGVNPGC